MSIKDILRETEEKMKKAIDAVIREFSEIRTGRAHPSLVEGIRIDYYGQSTLLKQLASISIPDARLIVIQPWDPSIIQEIEKAILKSNLGITPSNDGKIIRLSIPPLSKERREELIKVVKKMAEDGRISLRTIRHEAIEETRRLQKESKITEDERYRTQDEIQKIIDKYTQKIDQILKEKEKELMEF
jgi:ribosome recycling factor